MAMRNVALASIVSLSLAAPVTQICYTDKKFCPAGGVPFEYTGFRLCGGCLDDKPLEVLSGMYGEKKIICGDSVVPDCVHHFEMEVVLEVDGEVVEDVVLDGGLELETEEPLSATMEMQRMNMDITNKLLDALISSALGPREKEIEIEIEVEKPPTPEPPTPAPPTAAPEEEEEEEEEEPVEKPVVQKASERVYKGGRTVTPYGSLSSSSSLGRPSPYSSAYIQEAAISVPPLAPPTSMFGAPAPSFNQFGLGLGLGGYESFGPPLPGPIGKPMPMPLPPPAFAPMQPFGGTGMFFPPPPPVSFGGMGMGFPQPAFGPGPVQSFGLQPQPAFGFGFGAQPAPFMG